MRKVALAAMVAAAAFAEEKMTRFNFDSDTAGHYATAAGIVPLPQKPASQQL